MSLLIINNAEPEDADYNRPLTAAVMRITDAEVINYKNTLQHDLVSHEGIIISGVPKPYVYSTIDARLPYFNWLKDIELPVLGICLGHENIGRFFGASIIKGTEAEEGERPLQLLVKDSLFDLLPKNPSIFASHRASISLPAGFMQLASTPQCVNQVMRHKTRKIYGVQFHPEFSSTGRNLLQGFIHLTKNQRSQSHIGFNGAGRLYHANHT